MNSFLIAPSILSADLARLGEEVTTVLTAGADTIHFDVMDNHYVPNLTFGPVVCKALRNYGVQAPIDVHLMVEPVDQLIEDFAEAGASWISFHPEASKHPHRSIQLIKAQQCLAGIVINPATSLQWLEYCLEELDFVLLMSVNPGFGGQKFIEQTLQKIAQVKAMIKKTNPNIRLAVDGGININNIGAVAAQGADTFIAGSAIYNQPDYQLVIQQMREQLKGIVV